MRGLDPDQLEAARAPAGPLVVLAGAGAGKTRTLVARLAVGLFEWRLAPGQVLAITFTNKAAEEIRDRVERLFGADCARALFVSTFHAAALRLVVRSSAEALGRPRRFSIFDAEQARAALRVAAALAGPEALALGERELALRIGSAKARLWTPHGIARAGGDGPVVARAWRAYREELRRAGAFDFEDLVTSAAHLLESDPAARARARRFRLVLCDEYQDASPAQHRFVRLIAPDDQNVTAIGDDDQALYGWRGGDAESLLRFADAFPGARRVVLPRNYRSAQAIVSAGQALVARNRDRAAKALRSEAGQAGAISASLYGSEGEEAVSEAEALARGCEVDGPSGVAAVARTRYHLELCGRELARLGVPAVLLGALGPLEREEVRDALCLLHLAHNPRHTAALERAGALYAGVGRRTLAAVRSAAAERGISPVAMCVSAAELRGVGPKRASALARLAQTVAEVGAAERRQGCEAAVRRAANEAVRSLWRRHAGDPGRRARALAALEVLVEIAAEHDKGGASLAELLEQAAVGQAAAAGMGEAVVLSSVHQAKGLEWPRVHLLGASEGVLPDRRALRSAAELAAERRVAYVAITRARSELRISGSRTVRQRPAGLSRFVGEAGLEAT